MTWRWFRQFRPQREEQFSTGCERLHGNVTLHPDGSFTYQPNDASITCDTFQYIAKDSEGHQSAPVTVIVSVPPRAANNAIAIASSYDELTISAAEVLGNDHYADSVVFSAPSSPYGWFEPNSDGTITWHPWAGYYFSGDVSLTYRAMNTATGQQSAPATITLHSVGLPPAANDDSLETAVGFAVLGDMMANDGYYGTPTVQIVSQPLHGSVNVSPTFGYFQYTPNPYFLGTDKFQYRFTQSDSRLSPIATVSINMIDIAPVAQDDWFAIGSDVFIDQDELLANDTWGNGIALVSGVSSGSLSYDGQQVHYTASTGFAGDDSFQYVGTDAASGVSSGVITVLLHVVFLPDATVDDSYGIPVDGALEESEPGVFWNDQGANSAWVVAWPQHGGLSLNGDGSFNYYPDLGFEGYDSFQYAALGSQGQELAAATVTIQVGDYEPLTLTARRRSSQRRRRSYLVNWMLFERRPSTAGRRRAFSMEPWPRCCRIRHSRLPTCRGRRSGP